MDETIVKISHEAIKQLFAQMAYGDIKPCDFFDTCPECPFYVKSNLPNHEPCEYNFYICPKLDNI